MYEAIDIARWFIKRNAIDYDMGYTDEWLSNLKLQNLLYYAQGGVLAIKKTPLFFENILACEHGCKIPFVYDIYNEISHEIMYDKREWNLLIHPDISSILESVYNEFSQYSALKLKEMVISEIPWLYTDKDNIISKNIIKDYFIEHYIEK